VEGQTPIENIPQGINTPESSGPDKKAAKQPKLLVGALLAIGLVVGLYFLNRYWIAPAVRASAQSKNEGEHPLAPAFSLTDISGNPLKLSDYQGKVVMLDFWATWCGPCRVEIPGFIELQKRYASQGFTIVGISMDDSAPPVVEFYKQFQMNYPVAMGNDRLGELYGGMPGLPTTFMIGRDGRIYAKHVGATDPDVFETEIKELLAASPKAEASSFHQAGRVYADDKVELGDPAEIDSEVPGVNISKLTAEQKEAFKKVLEGQQCTCGCKLSLLKCRQVDRKCGISRKLAQDQLPEFLKKKS
jgi:thiol-disulfide isomerase/thioredoxin